MLQESRTTMQVKALLEDIFRPDNIFSLLSAHLTATDDMTKDIKEINLGYNMTCGMTQATVGSPIHLYWRFNGKGKLPVALC
jgi:hypothetical protein